MKAIVAVNTLNYIGKDGKMLWKSSEDFKHFKTLTMGGILIVGRITFEQCLSKKMLPGRETIVVGTRYKSLLGALEEAIFEQKYNSEGDYIDADIWVIGGSQIYEALIPVCDELHISHINNSDIGDCKFIVPPNFRGKIFDYYFDENK